MPAAAPATIALWLACAYAETASRSLTHAIFWRLLILT